MGKEVKPIKTGFRFLDETIGGYFPGEVTTIGGLDDCGKSAFIIMQALHTALELNIPTLLIKGSMSMDELTASMAAYYCSIETSNVLTVLHAPYYQERIDGFLHKLEKVPLYVLDITRLETATMLFEQVEKAVNDYNVRIVFCDDLEYGALGNSKDRFMPKELAQKLNIPIVCSLFFWWHPKYIGEENNMLSEFPAYVSDVLLAFCDYEQHGFVVDEHGNDLRQMLQIDILKTKGTIGRLSVRIRKTDLYVRNYTKELQKKALENLLTQNDKGVKDLIKKFDLKMVEDELRYL